MGGYGQKWTIMILLNQVYLANDLMNWSHWSSYFCMLIVMEFAFHLWHLNARGPMQYYLARVFRINSLWEKWSQNRIFIFILKNFLNYFCWKRSLKKLVLLRVQFIGSWFGIHNKVWISTPELFVMTTKSSGVEIQTLLWIPNHEPIPFHDNRKN